MRHESRPNEVGAPGHEGRAALARGSRLWWLCAPLGIAGLLLGAQALQDGETLATERADHSPARMASLPLGLDWDPRAYDRAAEVDPRAVELGRRLFFDGRLSRSGHTSCATCHQPARSFTDGLARAQGDSGSIGRRNVPTILNRAMGRRHFWDGRAATLAEQALGPILSEGEMGLTRELFSERHASDPATVAEFRSVFGAPPTLELAARAIAAFEATIVSGASPFDRYEWLGEEEALSDEAKRGLRLFRGKARCTSCHVGTNLTDEEFHNLGLGWEDGFEDAGRAGATGVDRDLGRFKTPTLRDVARTAPYMHDGSLETLEAVIEFYDGGGRANPGLDVEVRPLGLTAAERGELLAFLHSLTGTSSSLDAALFAPESGDADAP